MEDFVILFIVLAVYLLSAANNKKKRQQKKGRKQGPMRSSAQGEQRDLSSAQRDQQTKKGFEQAFASSKPERTEEKARRDTDCAKRPMHLHTVSEWEMDGAAEGEDPCHRGGVQGKSRDDSEQLYGTQALSGVEESQLAQDLLRGVIMSEILTRPSERKKQTGAGTVCRRV